MDHKSNAPVLVSTSKCFGGFIKRYKHQSKCCNSDMIFSIYIPPQADNKPLPTLYWLSGLTCTDENFIQKAGALRYASEAGLVIVAPDTSPRGLGLPGEDDDWDFGTGAGFYLNATQPPWNKHYRMYNYVVDELPSVIEKHFPVDSKRKSISGHSMGGHGALVITLRNPGVYRSVSAFAPIATPMQSPWGKKAFKGYLGQNKSEWEKYDASVLVKHAMEKLPILIDQGDTDEFIEIQIFPSLFEKACDDSGYPIISRTHPGYDHSYYFISTFIGQHIDHHMKYLGCVA